MKDPNKLIRGRTAKALLAAGAIALGGASNAGATSTAERPSSTVAAEVASTADHPSGASNAGATSTADHPSAYNVANYGGVAPLIASDLPPGTSGQAPLVIDATNTIHLASGKPFTGFIGFKVKQ